MPISHNQTQTFGGALMLALGLLILAPSHTGAEEQPIVEVEAVARAKHDVELGFTIPGRVADVLVSPGDVIEPGRTLVRLEAAEGVALISYHELRAGSTLSIDLAEAELAMARIEEQRVLDSFERNAAAQFEVESAKLRTRRSELELQAARQTQAEAQAQLDQARARHDAYTLRSPIAGVVERVLISPGETVEQLRAVVRIVATDPLIIEAPTPTEDTLPLHVGDPAWALYDIGGADSVLQGRITYLAQVADAASDTRLVHIEVANPNKLPAGRIVRVRFVKPATLSRD